MSLPRVARKKGESGIYHIIIRGINRKEIFKENQDFQRFIEIIEKYKSICGYLLYTYCLMDNHVHLLLKEGKEPIGNTMRRIGSSYVLWYNKKYDRVGYLFQGRYKSEPVEDDIYLLTVLRYILQNPVKAGVVDKIQDYRWTNYKDIIKAKHENHMNFVFQYFDSAKGNQKIKFLEFINMENDDKCLEAEEIKRVKDREAINIIKLHCKVEHPKDLQNLEPILRNAFLKDLKEIYGLTIRQIEKLTGIGRGIIQRS